MHSIACMLKTLGTECPLIWWCLSIRRPDRVYMCRRYSNVRGVGFRRQQKQKNEFRMIVTFQLQYIGFKYKI